MGTPTLCGGIETDPLFPKNFPENFIDGINPPKTPVKLSYRGGYGRGDPPRRGMRGVCHTPPPTPCDRLSCGQVLSPSVVRWITICLSHTTPSRPYQK